MAAKRVLIVLGKLKRGGAETLVMNIYRTIDRSVVQFDLLYILPTVMIMTMRLNLSAERYTDFHSIMYLIILNISAAGTDSLQSIRNTE